VGPGAAAAPQAGAAPASVRGLPRSRRLVRGAPAARASARAFAQRPGGPPSPPSPPPPTLPPGLGDCAVANEYRKFMAQCWFTKEADKCEKNAACMVGAGGAAGGRAHGRALAGGGRRGGRRARSTRADAGRLGRLPWGRARRGLRPSSRTPPLRASRHSPLPPPPAHPPPQWNDFAGCNVKARTNAGWVTGANAAVLAAYDACFKIKDPKLCAASGKVTFDPAVALVGAAAEGGVHPLRSGGGGQGARASLAQLDALGNGQHRACRAA
jgi:hypothetical protein